MKRSTRSQAAASSKRRKPTAVRPPRSTIQKKASGGGAPGGRSSSSSRKGRSSKPTYFSLLKDVEHALKHEHMDGASLRKLRSHLERRYGGKPFDSDTVKMLRSAVARLHKKGRIKKHPTKANVYKFKPPIVPAHHIFGTPAQRRAGKRERSRAQSGGKRSRPRRSTRSTRRTR